MKIRYIFVVFFSLIISLSLSAKGVNKGKSAITINFVFKGVVDSCNYVNRIIVYIDDFKIATSTEKKQSESNNVSFTVKKGKHKIKIVDEVLFNGKWEEQTIVNNYNIDAIYENTFIIKKNSTINLLFDIDKGVSIIP